MQEDAINVFCLSHGVSFTMPRSNQVVVCKADHANHILSDNFPNSGRWFYCCQCQVYWVTSKGLGGFPKQCPACGLIKKARYYSCDQCNVTMMDSLGTTNQSDVYIMPWGVPHPYCPGCYQLPKSIPQSHRCLELNGLITTARAECPFCEVEERAESKNGMVDKEGAGHETGIARVESEDELVVADASDLFLEELERKAAEVRALEAEAEAREAQAQERLRQVEIRLQQELSLRSEAEQKSREIEEELRQKLDNDWNRLEAVAETSETTAQIEAERKARLAAEQAKAEAEAGLREMEARACKAEERCRQAEAKARQQYQTKVEEAIASAQAAMVTLEEAQKKLIEAEAKFREMEARARRAETRSRQIYLISRLSFAFVEQIFGGTLKMSDETGGLVIPPDFATNAHLDKLCSEMEESNTNGLMEYGDFSSPDKLKALFEGLAREQVFDDEGNTNDNGMSLVPVECVMNEDAIPTSAIPAPTKPVIS